MGICLRLNPLRKGGNPRAWEKNSYSGRSVLESKESGTQNHKKVRLDTEGSGAVRHTRGCSSRRGERSMGRGVRGEGHPGNKGVPPFKSEGVSPPYEPDCAQTAHKSKSASGFCETAALKPAHPPGQDFFKGNQQQSPKVGSK